MRRILQSLILLPILIVIIALAIANRSPVTLSLDPFAPAEPAVAIENIPLFVLLFGAILLGILLGGIGSWLSQGKWRRRARDSRYEAAKLKQEADTLKRAAQGSDKPALPAPDGQKAA
ncbi:MAG: lipopolysaccharide assembly protein LapA domain-containing protein [Stappiaceae bacterium]